MAKLIGLPIPHPDKPRVAFLTLEKDSGERVEVMARKATYDALTTVAKRLTYALECAEYHSGDGPGWALRRNARRALWDADDKAQAEATAAAAKAAEEAKFIVVPQGVKDATVVVSITHHGMSTTAEVAKGEGATEFESNCRAAFATYEAKVQAEKAALASFALVK